ncbi:MAG: dual specificity protein phosphatase 23 [Gemmataceae bacterium]
MSKPHGFSWIDKPLLAAMAEPLELEEFQWLRDQGIQIVISLTEEPPRRHWINDAGLMNVHEPVIDMTPPTQEQIDKILSNIRGANEQQMGVAVHCSAGMGRTGTILACYFVDQGLNARNALARIRRLRPGSVETDEQVEAVNEYARRKGL